MGHTVILSDRASTACDIADWSRNDADKTFVQKTMRRLPTPGRSAPLWMAAAMLAMTWASETQASPDPARPLADAQHATAARNLDSAGTAGNDKLVQVVQATTSDTGQSPERERRWAETLSCELTNARRDIELLQRLEQERARAEWLEQGLAAARRDVEAQTALEETARVKQAAQSCPELQNSLQQEHERSARLEQDLAAARRDIETQTALAAKASEEALQRKQTAEAGTRADALAQDLSLTRSAIHAYEAQARKARDEAAELRRAAANGAPSLHKSAQDERERFARLEQDLAVARRDVETQAALAAKAAEEAFRLKQERESGAAELQNSLREARQRAERLEQDFAVARREVETQTALAAKASEEASRLKQVGERGAAELQQERERSARLDQDLVAVRRDVETLTALATKAGEETSRLKAAGESGAAEPQKSLQQERERSARLERDLVAVRRDVESQTALATKAGEETSRLKAAGEKSLQQERKRSARLERDLAAARRDVETQTALATKAGEETSRLKAAGESSAAELQKSLQQERKRSARLERDLAAARRDVETQTALATKAGEETSRLKAAGESGAAELQKSLQQERKRSARLERDLVAVRRDVETLTALATKAGEEASRLKAAGESGAAELQKSLQQERKRSARLERDLAAARRDVETQTALATKAGEEASRLKAAGESGAAEPQKSLQQERERSARLERDLAAARRDVETQTALATKAGEETSRLKAAGESGAAELQNSLQQQRERSARLEQDLAAVRRDVETLTALATKAGEETSRLKAAGESGAAELQKSLQQERKRSARLERDLVAVRRDVETLTALARKAGEEASRLKAAGESGAAEPRTFGTRGDTSKAQDLYARANSAGIQEAKARLEALRR